MIIAIFGGTGASGRLLIQQALQQGHQITAFARDPGKLAHMQDDRLTIVAGTLADVSAIECTVCGADAVISLLGPAGKIKGAPLSTGTQHIIAAMKKNGVRRLVALATASVPDPADRFDLKYRFMVFTVKTFIRPAYDEIRRIGEAVRTSGLDWTIVRVPLLTNKAGSERVKVGYLGHKGLGSGLSRADLAAFFLQQAQETTYVRKSPAISS